MKDTEIRNTTLILGFFDGIHVGHRTLISEAVKFAKENNSKTILLTFSKSPAEYFSSEPTNYIFPRGYNYSIIRSLGVDIVNESEFSSLIDVDAESYLENVISTFSPIAIFTGFNYTFGAGKTGTPELLKKNQGKYNYKYFCIAPAKYDNQIISSTVIKENLLNGNIELANKLLAQPFSLSSKVVKGNQLGRKIGFPTANMIYPENIIKIPFGVYNVRVFNKNAILNWGSKPTISGKEPILEVHIPNFSEDLYEKILDVQIIKRIRDEKKFQSVDELKEQIKKDLERC